jgi:hypothetical protein
MRFSDNCALLLALTFALSVVPLAHAQAPAPEPVGSCEHQVQEQYKQLAADTLVPLGTAAEWGPQLLAIVGELRVRDNQYKWKQNQAEIAERNWMRALADQRMRSPGAPQGAAPAN